MTGASCNDDMAQTEKVMPVMPLGKFHESISTHDKAEGDILTHLLTEFANRVHAVTHPGAMDLTFVQNETRVVLDCSLYHCCTVVCGCDGGRAQARHPGRNKAHLTQIHRLDQFFRDTQVAVMNGIESAAENADEVRAHSRHYLLEHGNAVICRRLSKDRPGGIFYVGACLSQAHSVCVGQ